MTDARNIKSVATLYSASQATVPSLAYPPRVAPVSRVLRQLIYRNVITRGFGQIRFMSEPQKMAERLLAHAKMCREVASECWNEELAADFNELALECIEAAVACKQQPNLHNDVGLALM